MVLALAAVLAVLRAPPRLDAQQGALLDLGGVPEHPVDRPGFVEKLVEGEVVDLADLGTGPVAPDGRGDAVGGAGLVHGGAFVELVGVPEDGGILRG